MLLKTSNLFADITPPLDMPNKNNNGLIMAIIPFSIVIIIFIIKAVISKIKRDKKNLQNNNEEKNQNYFINENNTYYDELNQPTVCNEFYKKDFNSNSGNNNNLNSNNNQNHYTNLNNTNKSIFGTLITLFLVIIIIFAIGAALYSCNKANDDNNNGNSYIPTLLTRNATNNDATLNFIDDLSLTVKCSIIPNVDIDNLKLEFNFYDKNYNFIKSKEVYVGNVSKSTQYTVTCDAFNKLSDLFKIDSCSVDITGGSVSYFA